MRKIEIYTNEDHEELEDSVNGFIQEVHLEGGDIISLNFTSVDSEEIIYHTCFIVYDA